MDADERGFPRIQFGNPNVTEPINMSRDRAWHHVLLDPVSRRVRVQDRPFRALRPIAPDETRVFAVVLAGQHCVQGFRNRDLQPLFQPAPTSPPEQRRLSARVSRLLALLHAHGLIYRVTKTNYYRVTQDGHLLMSTAIRFRLWEVPILAA